MLNFCQVKRSKKEQNINLFLKPMLLSSQEECTARGGTEMGEKMDKQHVEELKDMIREKEPEEPVEKVLVKFCSRHGVSLDTCRVYYNRLVEKGEIKEK
jgi:ribosomal protein L20A (L18A)